ncbi:MAG: DNA repair protein RecO [Coriobacteriia bacterium]|nr:DNA repair protein RecO [Coriobacteriia bacterium]MCL2746886.1 DNA repair protein RecO [Coriobacteriia bacterium]MCL2870697.1 DNA repair protein RecO [Coriobacteriia bacterium]
MRSYTAEVLVLGKTKLGETDLILTLLSSDNKQIRAVAKGARKPGAKLCGLSEPFMVFEGKFHVGKTLNIISEAKATEAYAEIRSSYDCLMAGSVILEIATQVTNDGDDIPRLYAMTRTFLDVLSSASEKYVQVLVSAYLLKALAMMGYSPEYELCIKNERLAQLFRSTFEEVVRRKLPEESVELKSESKKQLSDLRQVMNFTEKHLPVNLKALTQYRRSL